MREFLPKTNAEANIFRQGKRKQKGKKDRKRGEVRDEAISRDK